MDLILTGRGVCGEEARAMGLANRLVEPGAARAAAVELAAAAGGFPAALSAQRPPIVLSAVGAGARADALREETRVGLEVIESGETARRCLPLRRRRRAPRQGRVKAGSA